MVSLYPRKRIELSDHLCTNTTSCLDRNTSSALLLQFFQKICSLQTYIALS